jgi:hypothetical protein
MSVRIAWANGGEARLVSITVDALVLTSTVPWPPGSRIEGTVLGEGSEAADGPVSAGGPAALLKLKVHASRRQPQGDFLLEGRPIDLRRELRVHLEERVRAARGAQGQA